MPGLARNWARSGALLLVAALTARAQLTSYDPSGARSSSFVIHTAPGAPQFGRQPDFSGEPDLIKLESSLLAVSCERIKRALTEEIGDKSPTRGKIYVSLHPAQTADDEITLTSERFKDTWAYRLDIPNPVQRTRLVRGVVQALLQERANRNSRGRSAELPLWLTQGLSEIMLTTRSGELVLPQPKWSVNRVMMSPVQFDLRRTNTVTLARLALGERGPMTLDELSWPKPDELLTADADAYTHTAQLFIGELLQLKEGHECFATFFDELPKFLNWQTAFLRGFNQHFQRQIDLEKWWELKTIMVTGREPGALWTAAETWMKLDELIPVQVQARREKNDLPVPGQVSLGTVVRDWDFVRQMNVLRAKVNDLGLVRLRAAPEFLPLIDEYRQVLQEYLTQRGSLGISLPGSPTPKARNFGKFTARQLDALDQKRQSLRPPTVVVKEAPAISQR